MNKAWKSLSLLLSFILILGCVLAHPMQAKAAEGDISFTLRLSCAEGVTPPGHYSVAYELLDPSGTTLDVGSGKVISKDGSRDGSEVSLSCEIPSLTVSNNQITSVKISVTNAGYDIYYNGSVDNDWANGKTIPISDLSASYAFQLQNAQSGGGQGSAQGPNTGDVQIDIKNQQNGKVYYKVNGDDWTEITNNPFTLRTGNELNGVTSGTVYIKVVPNSEQSLDTHEMQNRINSGEGDVQIPIEDLKSDAGYSFEYDSSKQYSIQIAFEGGGQDPNPPQGSQEDVNLTVNWSGNFGEIKVGGKSVDLNNTSQSFSRLAVNDDGMIDVSIQAEITIQFSSIKINGTEQLSSGEKKEFYAFQIPKTDTGLSIDVVTAQSDTYTIQWAYDDSFGEDALVEHGNIEMISGYTSGGDTYWLAEKGAVVRVKLVPDYGYQVVGAKINGEVDLVAENESNEFTFEMPPTHVHFKGIFIKTEDIVANSSAAISSASFSGEEVASTGGTAKMTISEATPSDTDEVSGTIDTTKAVEAVDIKMDQLFYKNSADDVWSTNKTELASAAEVRLTVNQSADGYAVLREHNGLVEEIDATYNEASGTIVFSSDKYSTYTLVPLKGQSISDTEEDTKKDDEDTIKDEEDSKKDDEDTIKDEEDSKKDEEDTIKDDENTTKDEEDFPKDEKTTDKDEDAKEDAAATEEPISYVPQPIGDVVGGNAIHSWNDLNKALGTKVVSNTTKSDISSKTELVQLKLRNNNTTVPASTFANLSNTNCSGLHLFTGNGTAVTFVNDAKLAGQKAINIGCSTAPLSGRKVITFKAFTKLSSTVVLHATVPAGTKTVSVYFTGADKKRILVTTVAPTAEGRLCFAIDHLGKYELVYN